MAKIILTEKDYTLKEIEDAYFQIISEAKNIKSKIILENPNWVFEDDARLLFLDYLGIITEILNITNQTITETGNEQWCERNKRFNITPAMNVHNNIGNWLASSYLIRVFIDFEMIIRILIRQTDKVEQDSIVNTLNVLIDYCGVSSEYKNIFNIFAKIRNCSLHFGGIYSSSKGNKTISYKGNNFEFIIGQPSIFQLYPENVAYIIGECLAMYYEIISSAKIKELNHIPHDYTNFEYELEE